MFLGLTCVLSGLALGSIAKASGKPWQRSVPATILVFLVDPDDVGSGLAHATWDELRTRAAYDQLAAWQRRRLANAIAGTLNDRDVPSRLAALEMLDDLNPGRSAILAGVLGGFIEDGPTPGPPPVRAVEGETITISSHPPRPEHVRHDDLVVRLLGRVGASADVSVLEGVLQARGWTRQRSEALWALAVLNDPSAVEAMCDIPLDRQPWTEVVLAVALFGDRAGERGEQLMVEARARMFPRSYPYLDACSNAINGRSSHVSIALSEVLRQDVHVLSHHYASEALRKLGAQAEPAVPTLIEMLNSELAWRRRSAAAVLGSIGPGARQALPDLERLADDEDRYVSRTALWAIDRIRRPD
ncbi:MAG: HEAT repeat domain-containing protein [Planctomycetes bacterium]|nr:HEAT repeat domain-containing protein [Planctomycetota bacterium]